MEKKRTEPQSHTVIERELSISSDGAIPPWVTDLQLQKLSNNFGEFLTHLGNFEEMCGQVLAQQRRIYYNFLGAAEKMPIIVKIFFMEIPQNKKL